MTIELTVPCRVHFRSGRRSRKEMRVGLPSPATQVGVPRVAKLMALAIRFERLIQDGAVADQAELARVGHVTRARLTQIMNLLNLAPDIQEAILTLPAPEAGRDPVTEKQLRPVATELEWRKQRKMWRSLGRG
jgi:hypothetical protein